MNWDTFSKSSSLSSCSCLVTIVLRVSFPSVPTKKSAGLISKSLPASAQRAVSVMTDKKDPGKFTIRFNICDPQHKAVIDLLNRQGRSKAQFLVSAVLHYINCKETPEVSVPVPNQAALEEMILAILAKNQSYLKKQPEPKPSTAQQDAAISAASEPMPPADGAELEQWFGGTFLHRP